MAKGLVTLGVAAALGAVTLTTAPNPAAAQAFLVPAVVGAFLGAAATSHYYAPYGYYNGYYPASYGWGQSCGWGSCGWGQSCGWQSCGWGQPTGWGQPCGWQSCGYGTQPVVIVVR
jgi:hypothetical protein